MDSVPSVELHRRNPTAGSVKQRSGPVRSIDSPTNLGLFSISRLPPYRSALRQSRRYRHFQSQSKVRAKSIDDPWLAEDLSASFEYDDAQQSKIRFSILIVDCLRT